MTDGERATLREIIGELESDVRQARTRDEHVRLTRRVERLRALVEGNARAA